MFEVIITVVGVQQPNKTEFDPGGYPYTQVYRVEFDTNEGVENLIGDLVESAGEKLGGRYKITSMERLSGTT